MAWFSTRNVSEADVDAPPQAIWHVVSSPDVLASLTPLVTSIRADGDRWCWQMTGISALGLRVAPSFTELMQFEDGRRITFHHVGDGEKAGAEGTYDVSPHGDGTHLAIDITLRVDLPLPRVSKRAVERVMASMMERTGDRFARNLDRYLAAHRTVRS